jgi:CRISPR-associated endonuclease/helicase Cas3
LSTEQRVFYAHSLPDRDKQQWQPLAEHLHAVADAAGARGAKFGARSAAALAGLMHDLGKYSPAFQRRLEGAGEKVDHSTAGAQQIVRSPTDPDAKIIAKVIAHAIAGHHAGLPDTIGDEASLNARLKREVEALDLAWLTEISPAVAPLMPAIDWGDGKSLAYRLAFFGRMIFSCLVDADFRDTEAFYGAAEGCTFDRGWPLLPDLVEALISRFDAFMAEKTATAKATPVNALRAEILAHVRGRAHEEQGLFTLTVPTGGGKTLASLGFALDHAKRYNLDRIVYAIPFTSIIDQTAEVFRAVLGTGSFSSTMPRSTSPASEAAKRVTNCISRWRTGPLRSWSRRTSSCLRACTQTVLRVAGGSTVWRGPSSFSMRRRRSRCRSYARA